MTWYAAHLLFYVTLKNKRQTRYAVWENIVLINAETTEEAFAEAEKRAQEDACMSPDESFTWNGEPAEWKFGGIRKLTVCVDQHKRPGHGSEVTYLELEAPSWQALQKLIRGEPVSVRIEDGFPDEEPAKNFAAAVNSRKRRVS